jgi:hypothetical protein
MSLLLGGVEMKKPARRLLEIGLICVLLGVFIVTALIGTDFVGVVMHP